MARKGLSSHFLTHCFKLTHTFNVIVTDIFKLWLYKHICNISKCSNKLCRASSSSYIYLLDSSRNILITFNCGLIKNLWRQILLPFIIRRRWLTFEGEGGGGGGGMERVSSPESRIRPTGKRYLIPNFFIQRRN